MTVLKSFLLTIGLISIFIIAQLGFILLTDNIEGEGIFEHYYLTIILSFVAAYLIILKLYKKENTDFREIINQKIQWKIILLLIFIAIGIQLLNKPLWDAEKIWNYLVHNNYSKYEV